MINYEFKNKIISNVVDEEKFKEVQSDTLAFLATKLEPSFGPMGSNTTISGGDKALTRYTKDGKSILSNIRLFGDIEKSVAQDVFEITRSVVKNVGDGTTSAVILSHLIFEGLKSLNNKDTNPFELMREFQKTVSKIVTIIRSKAKPLDLDGVYKIAYISTNGNERFAENIRDIYERFGMDVFIDVDISLSGKTFIKEYNGMNLASGYIDSSFVNSAKNLCIIQKPKIYAFTDPINNLEQAKLLDKIICDNLMDGINSRDINKIHPTLILAPSISRDLSLYIDKVIAMYGNWKIDDRIPFCIVTNIDQEYQYQDIIKLLGCKPIQKSIDSNIHEELVKQKIVPTLATVGEFYGTCDEVIIDAGSCKFINPSQMKNSDGTYTTTFNNLIKFLETQLKEKQDQGASATEIGDLKRRIQSLKANLVEFHVGGITAADRDSVRDLIEDAVLNIRSAAQNGYGLASNVEGLLAAFQVEHDSQYTDKIAEVIYNAYKQLITILYENSNIDEDTIHENFNTILRLKNVAYNVVTKEITQDVISSIESDCAVLDAISKIVTLLFTSNQYLCINPADANTYRK